MVSDIARAWSSRFVQPIARFFGSLGLTPNAVTVMGFLMTAGVAFLLANGQTQLGGVLLILSLGTDAIDGALARMMGSITRFGAFLDSTLDRWAEVLVFGALAWQYLRADQDTGVLLAISAMATSLLVSYTRARAEGIGVTCREGLLTRFERLVILIAGLILNQTILALWIIAVLAGLTAIQRIWITWQADRTTR